VGQHQFHISAVEEASEKFLKNKDVIVEGYRVEPVHADTCIQGRGGQFSSSCSRISLFRKLLDNGVPTHCCLKDAQRSNVDREESEWRVWAMFVLVVL
jgi:hypothetical protein